MCLTAAFLFNHSHTLGPYQATYFATKAFANSFSQAVDQELREKGVFSTVLAPGYVETEFAQVAYLARGNNHDERRRRDG